MPHTSAARRSLLTLPLAWAIAAALFCASHGGAQEPNAITAFEHLVGGVWTGEGTWPDGSPLRVEQRYFWGPTQQLLHFETWNLAGGARDLLYEGVLYLDPVSRRVVQINVRSDGVVTRQEVTRSDSAGYEIHGADTRSVTRYAGPDVFTWELRVIQEGEWTVILDAEYRRHGQPDERSRP